jgi:hypothetical protein
MHIEKFSCDVCGVFILYPNETVPKELDVGMLTFLDPLTLKLTFPLTGYLK